MPQQRRGFSSNLAVVAIALLMCLGVFIARSQGGDDAGLFSDSPSMSQVPEEASALERATVVRVIDGDTLMVKRDDGDTSRVRLIGIDAPESVAEDESRNTPEGERASEYMKSLVRDGDVIWLQREVSDTDEYGRILRHVWIKHPDNVHDESEVRAKMLDAVLVDQGYAQSKRYSPDTYYNDMFDEFMQDACNDGRGVSYVWAESES